VARRGGQASDEKGAGLNPASTKRGESGGKQPHPKKEPAGSRRYEMRGESGRYKRSWTGSRGYEEASGKWGLLGSSGGGRGGHVFLGRDDASSEISGQETPVLAALLEVHVHDFESHILRAVIPH